MIQTTGKIVVNNKPNHTAEESPKGSFRQSMTWLHTWAGLTLGWILFFIFVTGTAGYFDTEIDRWMQPELPQAQTGLDTQATANVLVQQLQTQAPGAEQWLLTLPADRNQPYASVFWRGASLDAGASNARGEQQLDALSGEELAGRDTGGGQLLYQMHWRLHYLTRAYSDYIIAFATLFMFVGLITGVIIHKRIFKDFFTFRPGKGQRSWLDAHNLLSVITLPFQLMITYSGLIFLGFSFMPFVVAALYGVDGEARSQFFGEVFDPPGLMEAANQSAPLVPLNELIEQAESRWGEGRIRHIDIRHPGDSNARIIFTENIDQTVASGAGRLVFAGTDGELLHVAPSASSPAKAARDVMLGLHEGLFAAPALRWLYFLSGLLGTGMVATGLIMWAVKRREKAARLSGTAPRGLILVEKLNVGTVVGLPVGIAAYFWANRLLPMELTSRADWEVHCLFLVWLAMLLHAALRPTQHAWREQLTLAAVAFATLPLLNAVTTDRHLIHSLATGDWVFAGFDLTVLTLGAAIGCVAWRLRGKNQSHNYSATVKEEQHIGLGEQS